MLNSIGSYLLQSFCTMLTGGFALQRSPSAQVSIATISKLLREGMWVHWRCQMKASDPAFGAEVLQPVSAGEQDSHLSGGVHPAEPHRVCTGQGPHHSAGSGGQTVPGWRVRLHQCRSALDLMYVNPKPYVHPCNPALDLTYGLCVWAVFGSFTSLLEKRLAITL